MCAQIKNAGFLACVFLIIASPTQAQVIQENPPEMEGIDIIEHLGEKIPLDLEFLNENGDSVKMGDYFGREKPVLLTMVYYECPMLCTFVLNGLTEGVRDLDWLPGEEFQMISVSIDPRETPQLAANKQVRYLKTLDKPEIQKEGWAFLVGDESQSTKLADALGFKYYYDERQQQYAHPAAAYLLSEDGTISRYLYGISFKERDLRLGLLEASEGKIGNTLDRLLLYCFHYDPDARSYTVFARNVMRVGGAITLVILGFFLASHWLRERLKHC